MKFTHVGKAADGTPLALVVRAFSHYQPADANWNTLMDSRSLAQIAVASDSDAKFNFTIVDARSEEPFALPTLTLSILDIDQGKNNTKRETVMVYGYEKYTLSNDTAVEVGQDAKGRTYFRSGSMGEGADNPSDPMKLSTWQQRRAVEYEFVNKSSFLVETFFSAGPGLGGNLIFGGPSLLGCDQEAAKPTRQPQAAMSARMARALDGDEAAWDQVAALVRKWT